MTLKLGFGCMRLPLLDAENPASINMGAFCEMADLFLSRGFTYFDTAYMYHGYESERAVREALVKRHPRNSFTVATKLPLSMVNSRADFQPKFDEQLEKTGAGFFDYYLLHNVNAKSVRLINEEGALDFCVGMKEKGLIRRIGFSFHDSPELLESVLSAHPEVEFVQLQLNYLDWESDTIRARENYEVCVRHGKPVVVMEPVKGGMLADLPPEAEGILKAIDPAASPASWAVRFAASLPGVMMVLSGMSDLAQMDENTAFMGDFRPLGDAELAALERVAAYLTANTAVPCTACSYCVESCPKNIPIPKYFSLYNNQKRFGGRSGSRLYYANELSRGHSRAKECVRCGACARQCPQHLDIPSLMADVAAEFDSEA